MCVNLRKGQGEDMFPRTENKVDLFPQTGAYSDINKQVSCHVEAVVLLSRETDPRTVEVGMEAETGEGKRVNYTGKA